MRPGAKMERMGLPIRETERLRLRPWSLDDIDARHQIRTDPRVRRYLWDDEVISRQRAAGAVEAGVAAANRNGVGLWCVLPKPAGALSGLCGFRFIGDSPDDRTAVRPPAGLLVTRPGHRSRPRRARIRLRRGSVRPGLRWHGRTKPGLGPRHGAARHEVRERDPPRRAAHPDLLPHSLTAGDMWRVCLTDNEVLSLHNLPPLDNGLQP